MTEHQKMKLAAIEAMWETEPAPAPFTLFGLPDLDARTTHYAVKIPWVMGLIGTRSIDTVMPGIDTLVEHAEQRIRSGLTAWSALQRLREAPDDSEALATFREHEADLGYALLLKRSLEDPTTASEADIVAAADSTVPNVPVLF